jgi:hypothetical protein
MGADFILASTVTLSSAARFASLTSYPKLACDEVKGVTHFEKAVVVRGMLWLK